MSPARIRAARTAATWLIVEVKTSRGYPRLRVAAAPESCPSCGGAVADGTEGCQRLFESIALREYEDMRFARYHRIVVDVYAMQHPDRYGRSAKSFAAHLTGLCAWLEDEQRAQFVNAAVQRWLSGPSPIVKPPRQGATARSRSASWSTPTIRSATGWRWAGGQIGRAS